jgi:hypothetical protein
VIEPDFTEEEERLSNHAYGLDQFFLHEITSEQFPLIRGIWDKVLANQDAFDKDEDSFDYDMYERLESLLPQGPIPEEYVDNNYIIDFVCFNAVDYVLGPEQGYDFVDDSLGFPVTTIFDPSDDERAYRTEDDIEFAVLTKLEERIDGVPLVVTLKNSKDQIIHVAISLGKTDQHEYIFHKPGEYIPEIRRLQTVIEGFKFETKEDNLKVEYWTDNGSYECLDL